MRGALRVAAASILVPIGSYGCNEGSPGLPPLLPEPTGGAAGSAGAPPGGGGAGAADAGAGGASCAPLLDPPSFPTGSQLLTQPFRGIQILHRVTTVPRPLSYQAVLIDPTAPGMSFRVTPPNGDDDRETTRQTASDFVRAQGAQLAINAHFFEPWPAVDGFADLMGLAVSDGEAYSPFVPPWTVALNFDSLNVPTLVRAASDNPSGFATEPVVALHNTVGAKDQLVTGGANTVSVANPELNARTAIGLTAAGTIVAIVVDDFDHGLSDGLTRAELADLLIAELDVVDAINLDGAGSSTLAVADPAVRLANVPSDGPERLVGSHLGLYAAACRGAGVPGMELLAHEGFAYGHRGWGTDATPTPAAGGLTYALGGAGWAGGWLDDRGGGRLNGVAVYPLDAGDSGDARTTPLAFMDANGGVLVSTGAQARTSFGASSSSRRYLDLTLPDPALLRPDGLLGADGSTLWLSFLAQSHSGLGGERCAYVELGDQLRIGKVADATGCWGLEDVSTGQRWVSAASSAEIVFFAVKLEFAPGPERVSVWLDPNLDGEPATSPDLLATVGDLGVGHLDLAGGYSTDFDEVRLGTSFAAVAPSVR